MRAATGPYLYHKDSPNSFERFSIDIFLAELKLTLCHQEDSSSPMINVATVLAQNLKCDLTQKKYCLAVGISLAAIEFKQFRPTDVIDIISMPNVGAEDLISLKYLQVCHDNFSVKKFI